MGLNIKDVSSGGGGWFKADEHEDDVAILIECKRFDRQRPSDFGPKDSMVCDMTFFAEQDDLDALRPSEVAKSIRVEQTILCRDLHDEVGVGNATIVYVTKAQSKKAGQNAAWVWRGCSPEVKAKVVEYADKREAEIAAAMDAAPDFD